MLSRSADRRARSRKNKTRFQRELSFEPLEDRTLLAAVPLGPMQGGTPHYFGPEPNWAYSPLPGVDPNTGQVIAGTGIRKFVDGLPGLYVTAPTQAQRDVNLAAADNELGQYIPVAVPDTTTYPGSDYYEIELGEYTEQMHSDLNPTTLRGYRQTNTTDPVVSQFHNMGLIIVAMEDRPVRVKFTNNLPVGAGGDLFLPVDTTLTGAGVGPVVFASAAADRVGGVGATVEITTASPHNYNGGELVTLEGFTHAPERLRWYGRRLPHNGRCRTGSDFARGHPCSAHPADHPGQVLYRPDDHSRYGSHLAIAVGRRIKQSLDAACLHAQPEPEHI